jgi:tetratricopeptide (TPR) repeat protein
VTLLLAHPEAEDLGRFAEGTLEDPERAAIVDHLADCDDCRILVVDAAEFESQSAVETQKWGIARWLATAAAVVFVVALGSFSNHEYRENAAGRKIDLVDDAARFATDALRTSISSWEWLFNRLPAFSSTDPLSKVESAYGELKSRPIEGRLSDFPYIERRVTRGPAEDDDLNKLLMEGAAGEVMQTTGDDAKTLHAHGIANLVVGNRKDAIVQLASAADKDARNAHYWSDLAAADLAQGDAKRALEATGRSLALDARLPEALFNRALALQQLDDSSGALATYRAYLVQDSTSKWAYEAKKRIENLQVAP